MGSSSKSRATPKSWGPPPEKKAGTLGTQGAKHSGATSNSSSTSTGLGRQQQRQREKTQRGGAQLVRKPSPPPPPLKPAAWSQVVRGATGTAGSAAGESAMLPSAPTAETPWLRRRCPRTSRPPLLAEAPSAASQISSSSSSGGLTQHSRRSAQGRTRMWRQRQQQPRSRQHQQWRRRLRFAGSLRRRSHVPRPTSCVVAARAS